MAKGTAIIKQKERHTDCSQFVLPVRDTLDIINGKWKLPILGALMFGKKRFREMERDIPRITARMLSKELRELEMNQLITRTVYDTKPVTVEYEMTVYGRSLDKVLIEMKTWGEQHRKRIIGKSRNG
jgi:DNA-binding HxlR family transcriptional regulator